MMIVADIETPHRQRHSPVADQTKQAMQAELRCVEVDGGV